MLHGKGAGNYSRNSQSWLTEEYETKRKKGLIDRDKLTDAEIKKYEISGSDGGGRTHPHTYEVRQFPFPESGKETIDIRKVDQRIGEISD